MRKIIGGLFAIVLIIAMLLSGCMSPEDGGQADAKTGLLQLHITDKPSEYEILHANVTISNIHVHKAETDSDADEDDDEPADTTDQAFNVSIHSSYQADVNEDIQFIGTADDGEEPYNWTWDLGDGTILYMQNPIHNYSQEGIYEINLSVTDNTSTLAWDTTTATIGDSEQDSFSGWFTIINDSQVFDLILLQNVSDVLGEQNLTEGKYTQIRLTIESADITINKSGTLEKHSLKIPSGNIKLTKAFWIYENKTTVLTLDFDINESVHQTGNNQFIMRPTIKIIQE